MVDGDNLGLSTREALTRLHDDIKTVLDEHSLVKKNWLNWRRSWIYDTLHHRSRYTTICWTSAIMLLLSVIALIFAFNLSSCDKYNSLPFDATVIFLLLIVNLCTNAWDNKLRHEEILTRARQLLEQIKMNINEIEWTPANFPHLCSPASPCITLQWTYRDGKIINLPWALLVKGDVIIIRPGQVSPGLCISIEVSNWNQGMFFQTWKDLKRNYDCHDRLTEYFEKLLKYFQKLWQMFSRKAPSFIFYPNFLKRSQFCVFSGIFSLQYYFFQNAFF